MTSMRENVPAFGAGRRAGRQDPRDGSARRRRLREIQTAWSTSLLPPQIDDDPRGGGVDLDRAGCGMPSGPMHGFRYRIVVLSVQRPAGTADHLAARCSP